MATIRLGNPVEERGDFPQLGVAGAVDLGDLPGVGGDLSDVLLDVGMVDGDDVVGEKRELPRRKVLASRERLALRSRDLPQDRGKVDPFLPAGVSTEAKKAAPEAKKAAPGAKEEEE